MQKVYRRMYAKIRKSLLQWQIGQFNLIWHRLIRLHSFEDVEMVLIWFVFFSFRFQNFKQIRWKTNFDTSNYVTVENGIVEKACLFTHFVAYFICQAQVDLKWQKVDDGMINAIYVSILFSVVCLKKMKMERFKKWQTQRVWHTH